MRFEVDHQRQVLDDNKIKLCHMSSSLSQQTKTIQDYSRSQATWSQVSERGDKQTLVMQMMVRSLEDRLAKQARQLIHYHRRATQPPPPGLNMWDGTRSGHKLGDTRLTRKVRAPTSPRPSASVYNFVGAIAQKASFGDRFGKVSTPTDCVGSEWFAPLDSRPHVSRPRTSANPMPSVHKRGGGGGGESADNGSESLGAAIRPGAIGRGAIPLIPPILDVSKMDVTAMLLAAADSEVGDALWQLRMEGMPLVSSAVPSGSVTHR